MSEKEHFFIKQIFCQINLRSKSSDRKMTISDFQSQFSMSKIIRIFLNFFFHWRISIEGHVFCCWYFLKTSIFKARWSLKSCLFFNNLIQSRCWSDRNKNMKKCYLLLNLMRKLMKNSEMLSTCAMSGSQNMRIRNQNSTTIYNSGIK